MGNLYHAHTAHFLHTTMKIYFTCSTANFFTYRDDYFRIRDYLISQGHVLTRDWLPPTEERLKNHQTQRKDIKQIYRECIDALREADLVIIEDTVSNFSTGHQTTLALQYKRPTLVLWQTDKPKTYETSFIHGIESDILQLSEYTHETLFENLHAFIKKYGGTQEKNRFHLVLSNAERQYLDWLQYTEHKSRTTAIRGALREEMENNDEYKKYLQKD